MGFKRNAFQGLALDAKGLALDAAHRIGGAAFDAYGASGGAFVQSQLALYDPKLIEPLISSQYPRDIPVETGGGFPEFLTAYVADYTSVGANGAGIQGTNNSDIPSVSANVLPVSWATKIWKNAFHIGYIDLERANMAARSGLPPAYNYTEMLEKSVKIGAEKTLDYNAYLGFDGVAGLSNNTQITAAYVDAVGTQNGTTAGTPASRLWINKTPQQILADVNEAILGTYQGGVYDGAALANHILIPYSDLTYLMQAFNVAANMNVLDWIKKNNLLTLQTGEELVIAGLPDDYIAGQGTAGTNRMIVYRMAPENLKMRLCTPLSKEMTLPTTRNGGGWETIYHMCFGPLQVLRTQTIVYRDGI